MPMRRDQAGALQCRRAREEEDRQKDSRLFLPSRDTDMKRITKKEVEEKGESEEKEEAAEETVDLQLAP